MPGQWKLALVQSPRGQPDTHAVVHQHFHAVGAAIGEQISAVRLRRTEHRDHRANAVSVPARMSMGSVASQMASMRIIGRARINWRIPQDRRLAISP
jgi:hypothetical protein